MELKLSSNFSGKPVSVVVPIEKVIEEIGRASCRERVSSPV